MTSPWEHTTEWRDRFEKLQQPSIDPAGDPLAAFVAARIIELETAPRFDLTDELHDTPGGAIAQRYAEHLRRDCVVYRRIVARYLDYRSELDGAEHPAGRSAIGLIHAGISEAVREIAMRWADHPDFRDEWRLT